MATQLHHRALLLSYFTVAYNIIEGILSILAGSLADSIALIGFGLDSFVESLSGMIVIWRLRLHGKISEQEEEKAEGKAARFIGYTFFILALYVLYESIKKLYLGEITEPSLFGIVIAIVSLITMPILFYLKYRTGRQMGSRSLIADSKETLACSFLSLALLAGLGLNYLYGLWQADPVIGFVIVGYLIKEGWETLEDGEKEE
jgi:cation diffusion facilitator family transporter